ncbi:MAG: NTP transferase domain-containing protein [Acidobacteria bacterium]|nr:NTP transferase domain-containing protein [Acidobacteriota bacterium]
MANNFYPIILAGGRGTRFWPLSRKRRAKQLLALDGKKTMIQQTVERLLPLAPSSHFWVITNHDLRAEIVRQLPKVPRQQILAEPAGRNTAPAIGLAACLLLKQDPQAILGLFPCDHVIADVKRYHEVLAHGLGLAAAADNIVVLGIRPTRPETGYGYIEAAGRFDEQAWRVRRFTEKPEHERAVEFLRAGNYFWNSGMFLWRARTVADAIREHLPKTAPWLEKIVQSFGTTKFQATFRKLYPKCENISVDYAVLEPRSGKGERKSKIYCIPSDFGWNDLGSWTALHEHQANKLKAADRNLLFARGSFVLNATGNYVHAPGKFVATVGVSNIVVVETDDALLVTTRERSQDVGKVVQYLDEKKMSSLV